jgi:Ran GTPase-activating protein (RanGAP) involved in mRNA processing and transport
MICYF